ncbi:MAG: DUF932 domain-containing protein [Patescibacteria group bacterium]
MPIGIKNTSGITNVQEFVAKMGGDFAVETVNLHTVEGEKVRERYLRRVDTKELFACVGHSYNILQNNRAFQHLQPFVDSGKMEIVSGGIGSGGKVCYISGRVIGSDGEVAHDDRIENYFNIINPFDGIKAVYALFSPRRLNCDNQIRGVLRDDASKMIRIKHSSQVEMNLTKVMEIVDMAQADFRANLEQYQFLARRQVNSADIKKYVTRLWEVEGLARDEISTRTNNILEGVFEFIHSGIGQNTPSTKGSFFWLWQGVNGYLNHVDGRNEENRFINLLCGNTANFDQKCFDLAISLANAA